MNVAKRQLQGVEIWMGRRNIIRPSRWARRIKGTSLAAALALGLAITAQADRTHLKPGFNLFSPEQDVEIGRKSSGQAERQIPMLRDARVDNYLNALGHRLAGHAPGANYPYQYKCVNDEAINAFALPGGFVYINRGVIELADNEAQLAGVMAHETSHVALRHGTNQVSKAYLAQAPLSILGGILGSSSIGSVLTQVGVGFGLNSLFLKYSRTDETQADVLGTQILYDTGYDPRAMAQFFEKLEAMNKSRPVEFFSDHPSPEHRYDRVQEEVEKLGGPPPHYKSDSPEFQEIKRYVRSLPPPPKKRANSTPSDKANGRPALPSARFEPFENDELRLNHPDNWRAYGQGSAVTLAPDGGVVDDGHGNSALAYGVIFSLFEPHNDSGGQISLEQATDQLVSNLQHSNPRMSVLREHERMRVDGRPALSLYLANDSPAGGRESDWVVTTLRPDGLLYFVCVAPQTEISDYDPAFHSVIGSVRFRAN